MSGLFSWDAWATVWNHRESFLLGLGNTLMTAFFALALAFAIGAAIGLMATSGKKPLKFIARVYVEFIQNTPLLLQLCFLYYALAFAGLSLGVIRTGIIALGVYTGAYMGEVVRAAIEAVPKGQFEAAQAQGFNYLQRMGYIILPQSIPVMLPPMVNQVVNLFKNTSCLYIVGGADLISVTYSFVTGASTGGAYAPAYIVCGLILGSLLALARTYCKKGPARILGWLSAAYIELFRNTPYLLWIFVCVVFCPCPSFFARTMFGLTSVEMKLLFKAALALILFNSSVIAEIVRGGLNGVAKGQFEAGYAQGFNTAEVLLYIILPQAYRNIIPTLLSQVITTIKDSSYLANVATIELMARIRQLLSAAGTYNGLGTVNVSDVMVLFGTACVIYFVINFTLSCIVRSMQARQKKAVVFAPAKAA